MLTADSVTIVREASMDSPTVGHVSVAAGLTHVTVKLESVLAAETTRVDITVKGQRHVLDVMHDISK